VLLAALVLLLVPGAAHAIVTLTVRFLDVKTSVVSGMSHPNSSNAAPYGSVVFTNMTNNSVTGCPTGAALGSAFPRTESTTCIITRDDWNPGDRVVAYASPQVQTGVGGDPNPFCIVEFGGYGAGLCSGQGTTPQGGFYTCNFTALDGGEIDVGWVVVNAGPAYGSNDGPCPQLPPAVTTTTVPTSVTTTTLVPISQFQHDVEALESRLRAYGVNIGLMRKTFRDAVIIARQAGEVVATVTADISSGSARPAVAGAAPSGPVLVAKGKTRVTGKGMGRVVLVMHPTRQGRRLLKDAQSAAVTIDVVYSGKGFSAEASEQLTATR